MAVLRAMSVSRFSRLISNPRLFWVFLLALLVFFVAMLLPSNSIPLDHSNDKWHHSITFIVLTLLAHRCLRLAWVWQLLLLVLLALFSEAIQMLTPYRSSNWLDIAADFVGVAIGWGLAWLYSWFYRRKKAAL